MLQNHLARAKTVRKNYKQENLGKKCDTMGSICFRLCWCYSHFVCFGAKPTERA